MSERYFPDDHEADEWIHTHFLNVNAEPSPGPTVDQLKAAAHDATKRLRDNAPRAVADGASEWAFTGGSGTADPSELRGVVRQIMAAQSAGVLSLCPHTQHIRPLVLICDPPVIVCAECLPSRSAVVEKLGHFWDHQCDRCGVHVRMLTPMVVGGAGHVTVSGHLCGSCTAEDRRLATKHADKIVTVSRGNRRQRRGGGR
jgi:hypothetical protein